MYDYDKVTPRRGTGCVKWDHIPEGFTAEDMKDVIPMWVADMDFSTAPCVMEAIQNKVSQLIFGYTEIQDGFYDAIIRWFGRRHRWTISRDSIIPIAGLVPGGSVAIRALTQPGDEVIVQTPAYNCFFSCVKNNGRETLESRLIWDESEVQPTFRIDYEDLERKCSDPAAKLFILCNPQNPAGRIWTREELLKVGDICRRNGVTVVSDEIHCELEMPGHKYIPFASLCPEDRPVTFCSPSKSFNIAGLEIANIITSDPDKYARIMKTIQKFEQCDLNPVGVDALIAAYSPEGEEWLDQLNGYIYQNYLTLVDIFKKECPQIKVCRLEGTYLVWIDCKALTSKGLTTLKVQESLTAIEKVWINSGTMYGDPDYMRINIACPHSTLVEGINRVTAGLKRLLATV